MKKSLKIFLIEDDRNFASVLKSYLELNDYEVVSVIDGREALAAFRKQDFNICIFDVMLPGMDGFEVARSLRKIDTRTPFIFLTAKSLKEDVLRGYETGADDYITKPFDSEVLLCKIQAILNRSGQVASAEKESYKIGKYTFHYTLRQLVYELEEIKLTPREAELLKLLCQHINGMLPREKALKLIWGEDSYFTARSMDVFITRLRKYLVKDSAIGIVTLHGTGYRLLVQGHEE
jgi:DNA-binding response OmpR family regulator